MPKLSVNGVNLAYEVSGEGPPVAITPPGLGGNTDVMRVLAEQMASGHRVLVYDRRNGGASDIAIEGGSGEMELVADDLVALLEGVGMTPAYLWGGSGGAIVSLLAAHRHPGKVKGLLLEAIASDDAEVWKQQAHRRYNEPADLAASEGMEAVVALPRFAGMIAENPSNRDRLLSMGAGEFASKMGQWSRWLTDGRRVAKSRHAGDHHSRLRYRWEPSSVHGREAAWAVAQFRIGFARGGVFWGGE